jgi:DNA mismatch repair protein MutS2
MSEEKALVDEHLMDSGGFAWLDAARVHLEWSRVEQAVAQRCRSDGARRRGLSLASTYQETRELLEQTRELMGLLASGEPAPLDGLRDVQAHLARIERQGVVEASALHEVRLMLERARSLRGFLSARRERLPALWAICAIDPKLSDLEESLEHALEPDGTLSDRASPELRRLRVEIGNLRERIVSRLSELIERVSVLLSDRYYTLREGRYVLPVRRDAHERVVGIVHGTSQSGASVFVEPRAIVAHGNRLKMAEAELEREEWRILTALCEGVREHMPSVLAAVETLERIDVQNACARFGHENAGTVPELCAEPIIELSRARHPGLVLGGVDVVPNDLAIAAGQGIVISGPNAGGKTVLLKVLGLAALMVRHGLPVLAVEGSRVGFFSNVLTDIGDAQSTSNNLSTFSAHAQSLARILSHATRDSLVLLDEVATGTDPQEGGALACAMVDALCARGAALAVTTHYEPLKAHAMHAPYLRTASVGFDVERMEPSFRLLLDVPGASSALAVAQRFGIPSDVIEDARRRLPEQTRDFERLSRELAARVSAIAEASAAIVSERAQLTKLRSDEQEKLRELKRRGSEQVARETAELMEQVKRARAELDRARTELKAANATREQIAASARSVDAVAARVSLGGDLEAGTRAGRERSVKDTSGLKPIDPARIALGAAVHVPRLRSDAIVIEGPNKGRARIAVGPLKLWVEIADLFAPSAAPAASAERKPQAPPSAPRVESRNVDNTVDVRGMRVDDALGLVESFVDRMYGADARVGYVLHGHGSGALRDAIRKHLREHVPLVAETHGAEPTDGGDAITVFRLT